MRDIPVGSSSIKRGPNARFDVVSKSLQIFLSSKALEFIVRRQAQSSSDGVDQFATKPRLHVFQKRCGDLDNDRLCRSQPRCDTADFVEEVAR